MMGYPCFRRPPIGETVWAELEMNGQSKRTVVGMMCIKEVVETVGRPSIVGLYPVATEAAN